MLESLNELFARDLRKLKKEISSYSSEENIWSCTTGINNSGGNLTLHLIGNLKHFIGAILGNTAYIRERELEFSMKNVPVNEIRDHIDETIAVIDDVLTQLNPTDLQRKYPIDVFRKPMTTEFFLLHLSTHLNYHLGQINYHRRLLDK
ncbi:MAG: putative damage-inducible protein DinB [Flavobacteriales bacterium]|jgi:uncharacterized damage-inducible protein DinB